MTMLLLLLATSAPPEPGPTVDAAQLSAWVVDLSDNDFKKQSAARDALMKAGKAAKPVIPDLIKLLGEKDAKLTWAMIHAVDVLGAIGPDAKDAVPALMAKVSPSYGGGGGMVDKLAIALSKIDGPKLEATRALLLSWSKGSTIVLLSSEYLKLQPAAVVADLLALCKDKEPDARRKAIIVLAGLRTISYEMEKKPLALEVGEAGKDAPKIFIQMLADEDPVVRFTAAFGLSRVAPDQTAKTIPAVIAIMSDPKLQGKMEYRSAEIFRPIPEVAAKELILLFDGPDTGRAWAIATLTQMPVASQVESALKEGKTARVREAAAMSLGGRPGGVKNAPALKAALADHDFIVRFAAAVALVQVGGRGSEPAVAGLSVLIEGLAREDVNARLSAARNLCTVGVLARSAVPELKRVLQDPKPEVAAEAALALVEIIQTEATDALPALIEGVKNENEDLATNSMRALIVLGPAAKPAVSELVNRFTAKSLLMRIAAAEAAARIDSAQGDQATAVLVAILKVHKQGTYHNLSIRALSRIGPPAKTALPMLLESFQKVQKGTESFSVEMALAMIAIDPEAAKPMLAWLLERLTKDGDEEGPYIADQIRRLGARAKPLLPELIAMLGAKAGHIQECAAITLGAIGPDAKEALPQLKELLEKETQPRARKLAEDAMKKIEVKPK